MTRTCGELVFKHFQKDVGHLYTHNSKFSTIKGFKRLTVMLFYHTQSINEQSFKKFSKCEPRVSKFADSHRLSSSLPKALHTTPEKFKNATITGHFGFVFEENSVSVIT